MEELWEAVEQRGENYCNKTLDGPRGGVKLSKGNLYCPLFSDHYPHLYIFSLPMEKMFSDITPAPEDEPDEARMKDIEFVDISTDVARFNVAVSKRVDAVVETTQCSNMSSAYKRSRTE